MFALAFGLPSTFFLGAKLDEADAKDTRTRAVAGYVVGWSAALALFLFQELAEGIGSLGEGISRRHGLLDHLGGAFPTVFVAWWLLMGAIAVGAGRVVRRAT